MKECISTLKMLVLCAAIMSTMVGCKKAEEKKSQPGIQSKKVLARVDGNPIYEGDVVRRIRVTSGTVDQSKVNPNQWQRMIEAALESEIVDRLLLKAAIDDGIVASSEDVDFLLNRSKTMLGKEKFQEMLKTRNVTEEEYREFLEKRSLIKKYRGKLFADITIDEDSLKRYYEGHEQSFITPEKVRLEILIVKNSEDADEIYLKVKAGEDFEKVSQEYSNAGKEVALRRTRLMPSDSVPMAMQLKVKASNTGNIIEPTKIENGINIIKVLDKQPSRVLTYEEAIEGIRNLFLKRRQQKIFDDWYGTAKQKVTIEYVK